MNPTDNKINFIIKDLQSDDNIKISATLKKIADNGNETLIEPMLELYVRSNDEVIKLQVKNILSQLKISTALPILIKNIMHSDNRIKELSLHSIWSSNLDAADHIPQIVDAACKGDFMVALEALTLIENMEGPFQEEDIIESMISINEYFSESIDEKEELIRSMFSVLNQFEEQIQI